MQKDNQALPAIALHPTIEQIEANKATLEARMQNAGVPGDGPKIVPISSAKMGNLAETVAIGGLRLSLRAVPIKKSAQLSDYIEENWPAILIYAALGDEDGLGIDYDATAAFWSEVNARHEDPEQQHPVGVDFIANEVRQLSRRMVSESSGQPAPGYEKRVVDAVADAVWMLASETPDLTREALPDLLEEHLTISQYADLLRAIWLSVGGFPGSMSDRFGSLS